METELVLPVDEWSSKGCRPKNFARGGKEIEASADEDLNPFDASPAAGHDLSQKCGEDRPTPLADRKVDADFRALLDAAGGHADQTLNAATSAKIRSTDRPTEPSLDDLLQCVTK